MEKFENSFTLASDTGARLNVYHQPPSSESRAVLQINHGLAEHAARYARFARFLAHRGFHTYAHDHRGHGYTSAPDAPPRIFAKENGARKVIGDVASVHRMIGDRHPDLPVFVFGQSMGALIALNFVLRHPNAISAAAIFNATLPSGLSNHLARTVLAWERMRLGSDATSRILTRLTFRAWGRSIKNNKTDFDWLSRDADEVAAYVADPLCGWDASIAMWSDLFDFIFFDIDNSNYAGVPKDLPFFLVGGEADPSTNYGRFVTALAKRMRSLGFRDVTGRIYGSTRHESLNEINRQGIMEDFSAWAQRVLAHQQN